MITPMPDKELMKWVEVTFDGWRIRDDAPEDVRKELERYLASIRTVSNP